MISDFTSGDQIRAIFGVNDDELTDTTVALEVYTSGLSEDFLDVADAVEADYLTVNALVSRTAKEDRFWRSARMFATYACAKRMGSGLPMFGPKDISDGKALVGRFSDSPYKVTMQVIADEFALAKQRLTEAYGSYNASTATQATRVYAVASKATYDPVTGV